MKPYAPSLFRNGDLLGPDLLLKFQREDIDQAHLEAAWRKESKKVRKPNDWHWLSEMPLYCRGCSETAAVEVYKAAKEFPDHKLQHLWDRALLWAWSASASSVRMREMLQQVPLCYTSFVLVYYAFTRIFI